MSQCYIVGLDSTGENMAGAAAGLVAKGGASEMGGAEAMGASKMGSGFSSGQLPDVLNKLGGEGGGGPNLSGMGQKKHESPKPHPLQEGSENKEKKEKEEQDQLAKCKTPISGVLCQAFNALEKLSGGLKELADELHPPGKDAGLSAESAMQSPNSGMSSAMHLKPKM